MSATTHETTLEHLFDAELEYRHGMEPLITPEEGDGELVGSGDGSVRGPALQGTLRWTLFEHVGSTVCAMNPSAVIETSDGAHIRVDGRGWARRETPEDSRWDVGATLHFSSDDERYAWLDDSLGVWEGEFDAAAHNAHYRAYVQRRLEEDAT